MVTSFTPSPISALALTQRQLADWQQFHADLMLRESRGADLAYAQEQIDRLTGEVEALQHDEERRAESSTTTDEVLPNDPNSLRLMSLFAESIMPGHDNYSLRISRKGNYIVHGSNDYELQHGGSSERFLTSEEKVKLMALLAERPDSIEYLRSLRTPKGDAQ